MDWSDIHIKDDAINDVAKICKRKNEAYVRMLNDFKNIAQKILTDGVKSGDFHDKIETFIKMLDGMEQEASHINDEITKQIRNFLSDFEKADGDLY